MRFNFTHLTLIRRLSCELMPVVIFLSLAVWVTWPLAKQLGQAVPTSRHHVGTVPLLNVWTIWWNAESLSRGMRDYWNAPIFAPVPGTFALSEPQPITLGLAPLVWLLESPVWAYNVYLLATLTLNGWFAAKLLRLLGCWRWTQICGGAALVLHPLALRNMEAIQLLSLWASLWTIMALILVLHRPNWCYGVYLGLAYAITAAACLHHALFLALILIPGGCLVMPWGRPWPTIRAMLVGGVVATLLLSPFVWPMHVVHAQQALVRDPEVVASLSATADSWLAWPKGRLLPKWLLPAEADSPLRFPAPLLPGIVSTLLAAAGVAYWLWMCALGQFFSRLWRRSHFSSAGQMDSKVASGSMAANDAGTHSPASVAIPLLIALGLISWLLSFGPNITLGEFRPWDVLGEWLPPLARVRSPYRFAYFTQMTVLLLAAWAADGLLQLGCQAMRLRRQRWRAELVVMGLLGLLLIPLEQRPTQIRLVYPPRVALAGTNWVTVLANYQPQSGSVLCLPTAAGTSEAAQEQEARWMVWGTLHRRPILNGYSGFIPQAWQNLSFQLHHSGLTQAVLSELEQRECQWIVLRADGTAQTKRLQKQLVKLTAGESSKLQPIFDDGRYQVWRYLKTPRKK